MKYLFLIFFLFVCIPVEGAYNFGVVVKNDRYQIYRSAALGEEGLEYVSKQHLPFPKTIVYLNKEGFNFAKEEKALQKKFGYEYIHVYLDGHAPNKEDFFKVLDIILDPSRQPVLFHCYGGRHRTGMMAMALRYIQGGEWVNGPKRRKFVFPRMRSPELNPAEYEYAEFNSALFRYTNVQYIRSFSQDAGFRQLVKTYQDLLNEH